MADLSGPEPWRAGVDADRRRFRRPPGDHQRATLRRLTVTGAALAVGLNAILFVQTGMSQVTAGSVDSQIIAFINGLFPGSTVHQPAQAPTPGANPVVTTGAS
ncbi:MAG: hypothetical protein ACHQ0J_08510 [Candidatus Dormibacterales bacterium]